MYLQEIFSIGTTDPKQELLLLGFKEAGGLKTFFALVGVIGASDVDFTRCFELFFFEFKKRLNAVYSWPERKNSFVFLNAGTCGGSFAKKDKVGDCFHIQGLQVRSWSYHCCVGWRSLQSGHHQRGYDFVRKCCMEP